LNLPILVKIRHPYFGTQKSDEVRRMAENMLKSFTGHQYFILWY